jgi:dienelactone hydrolase
VADRKTHERRRSLLALRALLVSVCLWLCPDCSGRLHSAVHEDLVFTTRDGVHIQATLYLPVATAPPGLILVHGAGRDRNDWAPFAERARLEGYLCIAFDLRGHGESRRPHGDTLSYRRFDTEQWLGVLEDLAAAKETLLDHGADLENLALVGADIGGNLALRYALEDPDVQAVAMISPGLAYHGIETEDPMAGLETCPALIITSKGDAYSASSSHRLDEIAPGYCELREYDGSAHGTDILTAKPQAVEQILEWLEPIVGPRRQKQAPPSPTVLPSEG